jgi:predicted membrane protein
VGVALLIFGVLATLDTLDILDASEYFDYWPLVLIAIGVVHLLDAQRPRLGGIIWIAIGGWILLYNLGFIDIEIWNLWPLVLVLLGVRLVVQAFRRSAGPPTTNANRISALALLSGNVRRTTANEFIGGDLTAIMGGCEIDLRDSTIGTEPAVIDAFALWGGIELKVPESWQVVSEVTPILGGFENKARTAASSSQKLIVKGMAIMGGIEVKN